jgi:predicted transcriptional regulator
MHYLWNHEKRSRMTRNKTLPKNAGGKSLFSDKKRTTYEIYCEMLQICQKPQNKTRIIYKTNTSYTSFRKYLEKLQEMRLLQLEPENRYKTTERGKIFLQKYEGIRQFLEESIP